METITLEDLENKEVLRKLLEFVSLENSKGTTRNHIFKIGLIKHRGLTKSTALKVMQLSNLPL